MRLLIKNMVSLRCKLIVKSVLEKLGLHYTLIELGETEIDEDITATQQQQLKSSLSNFGLELIDDKKGILIEQIKSKVVEMVHYNEEIPTIKISDYLSKELQHDYYYLSTVFSEVKSITIEQYIIIHKIERAKELLVYDGLSLTQIAFKLNYSSVAHLSNQFKKITGLTPSFFKKIKQARRID